MNNTEFKKILREKALIVDNAWNPTDAQLELIRREIIKLTSEGKRIRYTDLQHIVSKFSGSPRVMIFDSVDNSDLNALLIAATKK